MQGIIQERNQRHRGEICRGHMGHRARFPSGTSPPWYQPNERRMIQASAATWNSKLKGDTLRDPEGKTNRWKTESGGRLQSRRLQRPLLLARAGMCSETRWKILLIPSDCSRLWDTVRFLIHAQARC